MDRPKSLVDKRRRNLDFRVGDLILDEFSLCFGEGRCLVFRFGLLVWIAGIRCIPRISEGVRVRFYLWFWNQQFKESWLRVRLVCSLISCLVV